MLLEFSHLKGIPKETLQKHCTKVEKTTAGESDFDGAEIMKLLEQPPQTALEMLSFLHENHLQEPYPNLWIALYIAITLPVTFSFAKQSFSSLTSANQWHEKAYCKWLGYRKHQCSNGTAFVI